MEKGKTMGHYTEFHDRVIKEKIEPYSPDKIEELRSKVDRNKYPKELGVLSTELPSSGKLLLDLETPAGKYDAMSSSNIEKDLVHKFMQSADDWKDIEDALAEVYDEPPDYNFIRRDDIIKAAKLAGDLLQIDEKHHAGIVAGLLKSEYKDNPFTFLLTLRLLPEHIRPAL